MKVLLVLALLLWLSADALRTGPPYRLRQHNAEHQLHGAPWVLETTHRYGLTISMTAGIPGMTPQVSKSVVEMDVDIRPKTDTKFLLQIHNVRVSKPKSSVDNYDTPVSMVRSPELETELTKPIKFTYEEGKVKRYTLGESESLPSKCIKRGILRHLEMKTEFISLFSGSGEDNSELYPIIYNTTETDDLGTYEAYYGIIAGSNPWFPKESNVFNISKTMDYEPYGYPSFHEHHNFQLQGCPNECKVGDDPLGNRYRAGCPGGHEPHQMPLRSGRVVHHHLSLLRGKMVVERINAQENTVASLYDQDMVVNIDSNYMLKEISARKIDEPRKQQTEYTELNTVPTEEDIRSTHPSKPDDVSTQYRWIYGIFSDVRSSEMLQMATTVWDKVSNSILEGDIESTHGQEIAKDVSHLQNVLSLLKTSELSSLWEKVVHINVLRRAPEKEKIKRQVLLDILPLTGTDEAVEFIKSLISARKLSTWEAKEVLEAIPENIIDAKEKNVRHLQTLVELPHVKRHHILHSAAYVTLSTVIRDACIVPELTAEERLLRQSSKLKTEEPKCSRSTVEHFLRDVHSKLKSANGLEEKFVYLRTLGNLGDKKCLELLKPYVYGVAEDIKDLSPSDQDFLKKEAVLALFGFAKAYGYEILEMIVPVYFNRSETPVVRMAAFTLMMVSEPSLAILQHIAQDSWDEPSIEVGNYVYSSFCTLGNASTPCQEDLASKIKLVISQMKAYDVGVQRSQYFTNTFVDELRNYGIDNRFAFLQNNESFIPSVTYGEMKYNIHSLQDVLGFATHVHGLSVNEIFRTFDLGRLGITYPRDIPTSVEREIFGSLHLLPTLLKEWRITHSQRIFYATTFHYFDAASMNRYFAPLMDHLNDQFRIEGGSLKGHLVKIFIPSSIHSTTYSSIGFPVDFRMKHPLVLSLKVESRRETKPSGPSSTYYIRPSVYYATYHEKAILNTANSHIHGVYHVEKHSFTLPMELSVSVDIDSNNLEVSCKIPEIPKRIYRRHSEAGTYVTELKLRKLLRAEYSKEPMKAEALFEHKRSISGYGLPNLHIVYHTEDYEDKGYKLPRDSDEVYQQIFDTVLNSGWTKKDVNVTIASSHSTDINEVIFRISYNRTLDMPGQTDISGYDARKTAEDIDEYAIISRILPHGRPTTGLDEITPEQVEKIYRIFNEGLSNVAREFSLELETSPRKASASLRVEYNRTLDRVIHIVKAWGEAQLPERRKPYKICFTSLMRFINSPSELHYDIRKYSEQAAPSYTGISFGDECKPLAQSDIIAKSIFEKVSPEELFSKDDFVERPEADAFKPESHEQCEKDIEDGNSQSVACLNAVYDASHFNKWVLQIESKKELPPALTNITYKLEDMMKSYYFANVDVNRLNVNNRPKTFEMTMKYFDKLTDTPLLDIFMKKPKEDVMYEKIDPGYNFEPLSSVYTLLDNHLLEVTNKTYPPSCAFTENYIRTFDMEEYPIPEDKCTYVLSTHCTEIKKFAVVAKQLNPDENTKEVTVYIADQKVVLRPSRTREVFTITHNGNPIDVTPGKPRLLDPENELYVYLETVHCDDVRHVLHLKAEKAKISIQYCGKNVVIKVSPLYKGKLCGLCGKFDGENTHEFRGSSRCLHLNSKDFAHSFVTDSDTCRVPTEPEGPVICPSDEYSNPSLWSASPKHPSLHQFFPSSEDDDDQITKDSSEPKQRNVIIRRQEKICFSIQPVPVCEEGSSSVDEYSETVGFHCLPKYDVSTLRLVKEREYRVLSELAYERVDFVKTVTAATSCSPY